MGERSAVASRRGIETGWLVVAAASLVGIAAFLYPFLLPVVDPTDDAGAHAADAPLVFAGLTVLCLLAISDVRDLKGVRICTIGPSTSSRLGRYGIRVDLMPAEFRAGPRTNLPPPRASRGNMDLQWSHRTAGVGAGR